MAEFAHLPLATDAYLGDTGHLTTIEHGAYLLLLITMWRNGGALPNDEKRLAKFARLTLAQWRRIGPTILEFFVVQGEEITQPRLTDELAFVRQKRKSQSSNARAKWRKLKHSDDAAAPDRQSRGNAPTPTLYSDTKVSAPNGAPGDVRTALFTEGVASLLRQSGLPEQRARALLGKWLKSAGDDAGKLLTKIRQAEADRCADPVAWIEAALKAGGGMTHCKAFERM